MTAGAFRTLVLRHGIHEEALDGEIGIAAAELPDTHADPADRMIVATAVLRGMTLITADEKLLSWKVRGLRTQDATS
jgi:PIN domain nuclease of toxin-antitoxin system